jgi:glycosyltransferase involved in cell wall biosynthesis
MHIALNAAAVGQHFYGLGKYIVNLIPRLATADLTNRYTVYASPRVEPLFGRRGSHYQFVATRDNRPLRLLWEQTGLPADLARRKVDLLHALAFVNPRVKVCPVVTTIHDLTFFLLPDTHTFVKRHYFQKLIPSSARRSEVIITVSESAKRDIVQRLGVPAEKVHVIYHGKDERFRPIQDQDRLEDIRVRYGLPRGVILSVGVIEPRKNLETLVRAYAQAKSLHADYCLVVAGDLGWKCEAVFRAVEKCGLKEKVIFPGFIPEEDLAALYNLSRLFVYPSLYEGFGLPVLEAMACGVPVITSNVSAMPEIAGDSALLIDPRSCEELAQAMCRALQDNELRRAMSQKGIERSKFFSWEKTARETLKVYEEVGQR